MSLDLAALQQEIDAGWETRTELTPKTRGSVLKAVKQALKALDAGELRVAEKLDAGWVTHQWLKKAVLMSFRLEDNRVMGGHYMEGVGGGPENAPGPWWDKVETKFNGWGAGQFRKAGFRAVPGAVVRKGSFIAPNVVLMPSFVNIGAYVGEGTMVDTWATVGSCAQVGKNVHLSGGAGLGGVLEPLQANPTIIEDGCFIGARSEVAEGVIVEEGAVLSMGVYLGASTKIVDRATGEVFRGRVPAYSVVVPGSMPAEGGGPEPLLRRDRQAGGRADPQQDQRERASERLMHLARFPRRRYTPAPTPIERLDHLTRELDGPEIWIKRDDLTGLTGGGNKTRKLEFLMADALAQGADTIITQGAVQSNHCRLTLSAAVREGLKCRLILEERVPGSYKPDGTGNNLLFDLLGVESVTVVPAGTDMAAAMQAQADDLARQGRKGYVIPGGGSNPLGALGYVACAEEILDQTFDMGLQLDHVVVASGSAGTHAGLLVGLLAANAGLPLTGDQRAPPAGGAGGRNVHKLAVETAAFVGAPEVPRSAVRALDEWVGEGYSIPTESMVEAVRMFALRWRACCSTPSTRARRRRG